MPYVLIRVWGGRGTPRSFADGLRHDSGLRAMTRGPIFTAFRAESRSRRGVGAESGVPHTLYFAMARTTPRGSPREIRQAMRHALRLLRANAGATQISSW